MKVFFVSFGLGTPFGRYMMRVKGPSESAVRQWLNDQKIPGWCSTYSYEDGLNQMVHFKLDEIQANEASYPTEWFN